MSCRLPLLLSGVLALASGCELMIGGIPNELAQLDGATPEEESPDDLAPGEQPPIDDDAGASQEPPLLPGPDAADEPEPEPEEEPAPETPADPECTRPSIWYPDQDGDGYGAGTPQSGCVKPSGSFSKQTGDCVDTDARVHPGQKAYFGTPYTHSNGSASFDFDCSGSEEGNTAQKLTPNCARILVPMCGGGGFIKANRPSAPNPFCGSTTVETCKPSVAVVLCTSVVETSSTAYGCH
jgi:hypothetical protein